MHRVIDNSNWNHSQYKSNNLTALISLGMDPKDLNEIYSVVVINEDFKEFYSRSYNCIDDALHAINSKYQNIWDFVDLSKSSKKSGGCSTCVAH